MNVAALTFTLLLAGAVPAAGDPFEAFAREVERGFAEGREDALPLDVAALAARVTAGIEAPEKFRTEFVTGMKRVRLQETLGKPLVASIRSGGSMKLLRVRAGEGGARALYRTLGEQGVNYLELYLERGGAGKKVRVVDCYVYISGETWSQMMRRLYLIALAETDLSLLDRLAGKEQEFLKNAGALRTMQQALQQKRHADVLATYEKLPASLRKERVFLLGRLVAASALGEEAGYRRAIEDFEAALPGDPSLELVSIDGHILRKQYDQALASVDRLDRRVQDPYLDFMRGSILLQKGDRAGAKQRFRAAIARDRTQAAPYWALVEVALAEKDHAVVAEALTGVERDAGVALADLEEVPELAAFVQSKEYRAWKQRRAAGGR